MTAATGKAADMMRFAVLGGCVSLVILANSAFAAEPSAGKSLARIAYEEQIAQAREKIHRRAAFEAQQRTARIEARKRVVRHSHPLASAIRRDEQFHGRAAEEPFAGPLPRRSLR